MARLLTAGAESNDLNATNSACVEFITSGVTVDSTTFRSGSRSFKALTGGAGTTLPLAGFALATTYYARIYLYVPSSLPTVNTFVAAFFNTAGSTWCGFQLNTNGTLSFVMFGNTTLATSATAINSGQWYRLEVGINISSVANSSYAEGLIDGVSLGSTSTMQSITVSNYQFGLINHNSTGVVINFDDFALNDSTGTTQNTWPGDGKVVLLLPISDNSAGSWRAGSAASATANGALFNAIDNTPPVGTVTADAVTACISNTISGATAPNGDFNLTKYSTAGITAADVINALQMTVVHGEDIATGTKTGSFTLLSNPATAVVTTIAQFGPAAGGAVGAYPTNWAVQSSTYTSSASDIVQSLSNETKSISLLGTSHACAQSFSFTTAQTIPSVVLVAEQQSSPTDNLIVQIRPDNAGQPSSTVLASGSIPASTLTIAGGGAAITVPLTIPVAVSASTLYWLVVTRSDPTSNAAIFWYAIDDGTDHYTGGSAMLTTDLTTWTAITPATVDFAFTITTGVPPVTVTTSPVGRITKTDTTTRAADCCFMGLYVDYTPAVIKTPHTWIPMLGPIFAQ